MLGLLAVHDKAELDFSRLELEMAGVLGLTPMKPSGPSLRSPRLRKSESRYRGLYEQSGKASSSATFSRTSWMLTLRPLK